MKPTGLTELYNSALHRKPFPYQETLGLQPITNRALALPTGSGKTAAAVLSWIHQLQADPSRTPKRLIYCLPMRSLVEQTRRKIDSWLVSTCRKDQIAAYTLMAGEVDEQWQFWPERPCIVVSTQDMACSRVLNRGYAMSRYRWPVHFALLNNDCFWVMDEVQLFGSALATSSQLQAFRKYWGTAGPTATWWMSATIDTNWLATVDFAPFVADLPVTRFGPEDLEDEDLVARFRAKKPVQHLRKFDAKAILDVHRAGTLTLVVVNTVGRAHERYAELIEAAAKPKGRKASAAVPDIRLIHSRFRPPDRHAAYERLIFADRFLRGEKDAENGIGLVPEPEWQARIREHGLIYVATQVVEAGLDISAETLMTEIAPWSNMVQRFGRCNRFGKQPNARIFWADLGKEDLAPYGAEDARHARERLAMLGGAGASPEALDRLGPPLQQAPAHVIRRHDLAGLFSTEPDLAGGFTDVSRFVRDLERDTDVYVFWREFEGVPANEPRPAPEEICAVRVFRLRELLGKQPAWEWNGETRRWERRAALEIRPGMMLLLHRDVGGYTRASGWTGNPEDYPDVRASEGEEPDSQRSDHGSRSKSWVSLEDHLRHAAVLGAQIITDGATTPAEAEAVRLALCWHDVGKAHDEWQRAAAKAAGPPPSPDGVWAKFPAKPGRFRPEIRHEAASALAAWKKWLAGEPGWTALAVYLVASHHGKVRTVLRSRIADDSKGGGDVFGIQQGDELRLPGLLGPAVVLDLSPRLLGGTGRWEDGGFLLEAPGWVEVVADLLGDEAAPGVIDVSEPRALGPFRLAMLEAWVVASDARASRAEENNA